MPTISESFYWTQELAQEVLNTKCYLLSGCTERCIAPCSGQWKSPQFLSTQRKLCVCVIDGISRESATLAYAIRYGTRNVVCCKVVQIDIQLLAWNTENAYNFWLHMCVCVFSMGPTMSLLLLCERAGVLACAWPSYESTSFLRKSQPRQYKTCIA